MAVYILSVCLVFWWQFGICIIKKHKPLVNKFMNVHWLSAEKKTVNPTREKGINYICIYKQNISELP